MRKMRFGPDEGRLREASEEGESEHERNRRVKNERERLLRRELSRLRSSQVISNDFTGERWERELGPGYTSVAVRSRRLFQERAR